MYIYCILVDFHGIRVSKHWEDMLYLAIFFYLCKWATLWQFLEVNFLLFIYLLFSILQFCGYRTSPFLFLSSPFSPLCPIWEVSFHKSLPCPPFLISQFQLKTFMFFFLVFLIQLHPLLLLYVRTVANNKKQKLHCLWFSAHFIDDSGSNSATFLNVSPSTAAYLICWSRPHFLGWLCSCQSLSRLCCGFTVTAELSKCFVQLSRPSMVWAQVAFSVPFPTTSLTK